MSNETDNGYRSETRTESLAVRLVIEGQRQWYEGSSAPLSRYWNGA